MNATQHTHAEPRHTNATQHTHPEPRHTNATHDAGRVRADG